MAFEKLLLDWYAKNARELPWRSRQSAYRTWVSEIMLQQTQVDTVIPYFEAWMARFPDIKSLAAADEQEVLTLWEGLGYYSRARNLHRAARILVAELDGELPQNPEALQRLPGIGPYTAAAIASIAFGADVAAVDGNIRRVLSRLFNVTIPARSTEGEKIIWKLAEENLPAGCGGTYNQALMDLGASICTPVNPSCDSCPVSSDCLAFELGVQEERPVKLPRKKVPHYLVTAAVIQRDGRVLLAQRHNNSLLGGLWEFPGGTLEEVDANLEACLKREIQEELGVDIRVGTPFGNYKHAYTHFKITLHAFLCELLSKEEPQPLASQALEWVYVKDLEDIPWAR
ncbi:MAG: A/G-specific adenine glycosylase [Anaerolineae bacterium 49_20]|nr:MAG: A/G-specific adenine glycosylase [Anaerolineae bacterium 49_20]